MTFYRDLETGRLVLESSRDEWQALPSENRRRLKSQFRFYRSAGEWRSRASKNIAYARQLAEEAGFEYRGEEGEPLDFDEQRERQIERSRSRAEYLTGKAEKKAEAAAASFKRADEIVKHIPLGQPILVGHHSERGHRRTIERAHAAGFKGVDLSNEAKETERKAQAAAQNAARLDGQLKNRRYLTAKLKEATRQVNVNAARLKACETGEDVRYGSHAGAIAYGSFEHMKRDYKNGRDRSHAEYLELLEANAKIYRARLAAAEKERDYWQGYLDELPEGWDRAKLKTANPTHVRYRGRWYPVVRINAKTVTVGNWLDCDLEWKVPHEEIQGVRLDD